MRGWPALNQSPVVLVGAPTDAAQGGSTVGTPVSAAMGRPGAGVTPSDLTTVQLASVDARLEQGVPGLQNNGTAGLVEFEPNNAVGGPVFPGKARISFGVSASWMRNIA